MTNYALMIENAAFADAWTRYAAASAAYFAPSEEDISNDVGKEFHAALDAMMLTRAGCVEDLWMKWGVLEENMPEAMQGGAVRGYREIVWQAAIKADVAKLLAHAMEK
ncbi:MAG TPA: hypothetical protein PLV61_15440 [Parvularculaceae bacterium]|nr:hypothetical protein [Parvularculaceae bacterium]